MPDPKPAPPPPTPEPEVFVEVPWIQPGSCWSVLVVPPAQEPYDLEHAKALAGLSWVSPDPRDEMVSDFIAAARNKVELDTGLALLTQTRDVYYTAALVGPLPLPSRCLPAQSITDVTPAALGRREARVTADGRLIVEPGASGVLRVVAGWSAVDVLRGNVPLLYHAVGLLIAHYLTLGRDLAVTGAVASVNIIPEGYEDAIAPHRLMWVT
jgi:hypothetical protein